MTGQINFDMHGIDVVVEYEAAYTPAAVSGPPEKCYEAELDIEIKNVCLPWGTVIDPAGISANVYGVMVDAIASSGEFVDE